MTQATVSDSARSDAMRLRTYLSRCVDTIVNVAGENAGGKAALQGALQLRGALIQAEPRQFKPESVAVIDSMVEIESGLMIDEFRSLSTFLPWKPSFRSDDGGREMALASVNDVLELGDVVCGFIFVGANYCYPEHQHEPQELYLTLSGGARWRFGGDQHYQMLDAGAVIYNKPWDLHGVQAIEKPSLALYVLWPPTETS